MPENSRAGELPADYYLQNFHTLVSFVQDTYGAFLLPAEFDWVAAIGRCRPASQRLYVRLLCRKSHVFRRSRLSYKDIPDIDDAAAELADAGLVLRQPPESLATLFRAFTFAELRQWLKPELPPGARRADFTDHRLAENRLDDHVRLAQADEWLCLTGHEHLTLFTLCFFGNLYQDISEFVRSDLGNVRYEPYAIEPGSQAFQSRAHIEAHLRVFECDVLLDHTDSRDLASLLAVESALPERLQDDPHLCRRLDRLRNRLARHCERLQATDTALQLYGKTQAAPSRERRIRLLIATERLNEAAMLCRELLEKPLCEAEYQVGLRLANTVGSNTGLAEPSADIRYLRTHVGSGRQSSGARYKPPSSKIILSRTGARVERVARDFYARFGECHEVENALLTGVLGLFIWDILFLNVPGAFFNPFQSAPADFHEPDFQARRADALSIRFEELSDRQAFATRVLDRFQGSRGIANPLVHWSRLSEAVLNGALERIPAEHWRCIFERILSDMRENCNGLPDLILFPDKGGYELIEIKGPGDALQQNQRRWMRYFAEHGIPSRVVHVAWAPQSHDPQSHAPQSHAPSVTRREKPG